MKRKKKMEEQANMISPFDDLTEEIIFAILDYLNDDPLAKKSFSLVSKYFYSIESQHRKSVKPLCSELLSNILHRYPSLSHIDLSLCPRTDDNTLELVSILCKSTLRSVNLSRSRFFTGVGLSNLVTNCLNLVEIDLSNVTELTDSAVAAAAVAGARNLQKLWLARCKRITDMGIGCVAVGCRMLRLICLKWCLRVTDMGVALIAMKCKELRSLDLSYLPITEKCLPPILQLQHLENLILVGCLGMDDDGLASLKESSKSLKILNLSHCQNVSHLGLSSLTNGAGGLHKLTLAYGFAVSNDLAKCLQNFSGLQCLKLDGCLITCSGLKAIGDWCASLKELSLSKCSGVTDEGLSFLVQRHKELKMLDITCCCKITLASIDSITSFCTSLTSLRMESCGLVSKEAFVLIGQRCPFLEELDITESEIEDEGLQSISRCCKLSSLKLGMCLNITNDGISHIGKGCPKLRTLDLYRSVGITDVGIAAIARGCCSTLENINIAYNGEITDDSLISLSKCLRLKALEIRGCTRVSSEGLAAIAVGCRQLTILDIKKCYNINDMGMIQLAQYLHNLQQINLSYCSVTDIGLLALGNISQLQSITILHSNGLTPNALNAALLAFGGLTKVKLHASFKLLVPQSIIDYMEARGCVVHWRNKAA